MKTNNIIGSLHADAKRAFGGYAFLLCVAGIALLYAIIPLYEISIGGYEEDFLYYFRLSFSVNELQFGILLLASIPHAMSFSNDMKSKYIRSVITRTPLVKYCISRAIIVFLSSFLAVLIGLMIYTLFIAFFFPLDVLDGSFSTIIGIVNNNAKLLQYIIFTMTTTAIGVAFFSLLTTLVSTFVQDAFVVFFTPLILYYSFDFISHILRLPVYINASRLFKPNTLMNIGIQQSSISFTVLYIYMFYLFLSIIICCIFTYRVRRKVLNGDI